MTIEPKFDLSVVGELNLDLILYGLPATLELDREHLASELCLTLGSSSAIFAHNFALLGNRVAFHSVIGDDPLGEICLKRLGESGADVSGVCRVPGRQTGLTIVLPQPQKRIILIYLPLLFALGGLLYLVPQTIKLPATVKGIFDSWASTHPVAKGVMTFCFACALVLNLVVIKQLWQNWLRRKRQQPVMVVRTWVWQTFLIGLLFLAAGFGVGRLWSVSISKYFEPVRQINVLLFLLVAGFARVVQFFFKSFVGDVAVYTNADAKAKNFLVRKAILNSSTNAVIRLLQEKHVAQANDPYDQVIVAGHSLGSVIAYDTLNQLLNKRYSREDQIVGSVPEKTKVTQDELNKIRGLVTFGCPLDKVHYFFRENVPPHQAIRAQLLQFLQSFRKRPSNYDYGLYRLQRYDASGLNSVLWLNAWSRQDPVSGALHFYTGLTRRHFKYKIPIYAHLSYWEDLRFYEFFSEPLLLGNQAALKQKAMSAGV